MIRQLLSVAYMSAVSFINEDLCMKWIEHFQKLERIAWKILLILDGRVP